MTDEPPLLVVTALDGRRFAVVRAKTGPVVDSLDTGERLGPLRGDLVALPVTLDGAPHAVLAGPDHDQPRGDHVLIQWGHDAPRRYQLKNGVWLTEPLPFTPDMHFTASWRERNGRELRRYQSPPLASVDALEPVYGPGWISHRVGD